jgi:hypothetical protein
MAFYKLENNQLTSGNYICGNDENQNGYDLNELDRDTYTYPVYGWYWFDTEEMAKAYFGVE